MSEGIEDCVVESHDHIMWIQAKSRSNRTFGKAEVRRILDTVDAKAALFPVTSDLQTAAVLEQPATGVPTKTLDHLFDGSSESVIHCPDPASDILDLLSDQLDVAPVLAEGLRSDLYQLVADASATNATASFDNRVRISTIEVERRILERLEAEDPSAIDEAMSSGYIAPVDFATPINEPAFYQGVKVRPGHVAAGLVLGRNADVANVVNSLERRRQVLLTGPSGAGKSALTWLSAHALVQRMRCFEVTSIADVAGAHAVVRFVRSHRPTELSPIALVFDDIAASRSALWDVLVRELRGMPAVYLLGSVRQEDLSLIADRSDTEFVPVALDAALAETIWDKLSSQRETSWIHWAEPFEQSEGLLLEYVHLLARGRRLAAVIEGQVRQRESERRNDELGIIRTTAVLASHGGEIDATKLFRLLGLEPDAASRAMKRLLDEHLVLERQPGVLGGLHMLRSRALLDASHDEIAYLSQDTLWRCLPAATYDTLPRVIQSILATAAFALPGVDLPELSRAEDLEALRNAIGAFGDSAKLDLRSDCLARLPDGHRPPPCDSLSQANRLLSSLVSIFGARFAQPSMRLNLANDATQDIREIAMLLSTAYAVSPHCAKALVEDFGGQEALLELFRSQTPWATDPIIVSDGRHGRTIRSDWCHLAAPRQPDPHEAVCQICETLIGLSPDAEAAASNAINPLGQPITIGEFTPWSKNMPRKNLPAKSQVAWNVAFRQIMLARVAPGTLTEYAYQMAVLVRRTEKLFRTFTEKWIHGKTVPSLDAWVADANDTVASVKALAYATPETPASVMTEQLRGGGVDDTLGALLTGVLANLVRRLGDSEGAKGAAAFAGNLAEQARQHHRSQIWRTSPSPPLKELADLSTRLRDVSCVLHERSHDSSQGALAAVRKIARKRAHNRSVAGAAAKCRTNAKRRFEHTLRRLEHDLKGKGHPGCCCTRPIRKLDSVYWPARELAVLIEVEELGLDALLALEEALNIAQQHLGTDWPYSAAPVVRGQVVASLALCPSSSHAPLPDLDFTRDWSPHLDQPILSASSTRPLDDGVDACNLMSAVLTSRGTGNLHPDEEAALSHAVESFDRARAEVAQLAEETGLEHWILAAECLDETRDRVAVEYSALENGQRVDSPLCAEPYQVLAGDMADHATMLVAIRFAILDAESRARPTATAHQ